MNPEERINVFRDMIEALTDMWLLVTDSNFKTVSSSENMNEDLYKAFFLMDGTIDATAELPSISNYPNRPVFVSNHIGMSWITDVSLKDNIVDRIYILGPAFCDEYSMDRLSNRLDELPITVKLKHHVMGEVNKIPVVPMTRLLEYGIMMHSVLTGEKVSFQDFEMVNREAVTDGQNHEFLTGFQGMYTMEQHIKTLVREGNIEFDHEIKRFSGFEQAMFKGKNSDIRMQKDMMVILASHCATAATEGGILSGIAYELRSEYINLIEEANNTEILVKLAMKMIGDFVRRVRRVRIDSDVSPQIRAACDYIELHPEMRLDVHALAEKYGYKDYYFSNKFKQEMKISIRDYTMQCKINKACQYLKETSMQVIDISMALGFVSQSHFGEVFKKQMGMSPVEYKNSNV